MGLVRRIKFFFTGIANDALDKLENPIIVAKENIRKLDNDILKARQSLFSLVGNLKLLQAKESELQSIVSLRSDQLKELELKANDEVELQEELKATIEENSLKLADVSAEISHLQESVDMLENEIGNAEKIRADLNMKLSKLTAEYNASKALNKATDVVIQLDGNEVGSEFNRLSNKVKQEHAEALAKVEYIKKKKEKKVNLDDRVKTALSK